MTLTTNITNQLVSKQFTHDTYHPPSHPSNLGPRSTLLFTHTHFAPKPSFNVKSVLMSPTYNIRSVFKYSTCFSLFPTSKTLCLISQNPHESNMWLSSIFGCTPLDNLVHMQSFKFSLGPPVHLSQTCFSYPLPLLESQLTPPHDIFQCESMVPLPT